MISSPIRSRTCTYTGQPKLAFRLLDLHTLHSRLLHLLLPPRDLLLLLVLVPKIADVQVTQELPPVLSYVEEVVGVTRVSISMTGGDDRTATEFLGFFVGQVPSVALQRRVKALLVTAIGYTMSKVEPKLPDPKHRKRKYYPNRPRRCLPSTGFHPSRRRTRQGPDAQRMGWISSYSFVEFVRVTHSLVPTTDHRSLHTPKSQ